MSQTRQVGDRGWVSRVLRSEEDRSEVDRLLRVLIDEPGQVPMLPGSWESQRDLSSLVIGAYAGQNLIGGLWAGDPYTEFIHDPHSPLFPPEV